jgi:hypothetical protein
VTVASDAPFPKHPLHQSRLPWSFFTLRRHQMRAVTCAGLTSPSCATPSGFLNLLTFHSALILPALFHAGTARGLLDLQRFPPRASRQHLSMQASPHVLSS